MRILAFCLFLASCGVDDRPARQLVDAFCADVKIGPVDCDKIKKENNK